MKNLQLIREQIKLTYPKSVIDNNSNSDTIIYLTLEPFGKISMDNKFNIEVLYFNPFNIDFDYFKKYFEVRLKFENAATYIYEDKISIYKRSGNDSKRTAFENSMNIAYNFITVAKEIESFIKYNTFD